MSMFVIRQETYTIICAACHMLCKVQPLCTHRPTVPTGMLRPELYTVWHKWSCRPI